MGAYHPPEPLRIEGKTRHHTFSSHSRPHRSSNWGADVRATHSGTLCLGRCGTFFLKGVAPFGGTTVPPRRRSPSLSRQWFEAKLQAEMLLQESRSPCISPPSPAAPLGPPPSGSLGTTFSGITAGFSLALQGSREL